MRIRHKLLALLLFFAVVPLLLSIVISHTFFYRTGLHLAEETERQLSEQAHASLQKLVDSFQRSQERDHRMMAVALSLHAGLGIKTTASSSTQALSPPLAYAAVQQYRPGMVSRQSTILETGDSSCYPSYDQCFGSGDPRLIPWYQKTKKRRTQTRTLALDPVSDEPAIIVARPLTEVGGRFSGVTALTRPVNDMFADLQLSKNWFGSAREMLVMVGQAEESDTGGLRILTVREAEHSTSLWRGLSPQTLLRPDTVQDTQRLLQLIGVGQGGSLELDLQGIRTHWIFGAAAKGELFALILVPHSQVTAQAVAAKDHVVANTLNGLKISAALLACAIAAVFFTAVLASKKVTSPLSQLAKAAGRLAGGDYRTRVEISSGDEVEELGQVFNQLGPALAERERMASSLALAGDIQRHLLPQTQPQVSGFEIFAGAQPCDETGGDYYDFMILEDGNRLALVVGDVSGHGAGAALLMAGARGVLRSYALHQNFDLSKLFSAMNEHLCRDTADEQFMTLFYGVLDERDRTLRWCSAGHGPCFLYRCREKNIIELGSTGLPLGIISESTWEEGAPIVFENGDILLVGTDGIWEACNSAGEALGTKRLSDHLCSHAAESAAQIHASIMELVKSFRGDNRQEDDITLSVVKAISSEES